MTHLHNTGQLSSPFSELTVIHSLAILFAVMLGIILTILPLGTAEKPCTLSIDKTRHKTCEAFIGVEVTTEILPVMRGSTIKFLPVASATVSIRA